MNATLSEKGQVTIPKALRDDLGLVSGMILDFSEEGGRIIIKKIVQESPISAWKGRGRLPRGDSVTDYLNESRDAQ